MRSGVDWRKHSGRSGGSGAPSSSGGHRPPGNSCAVSTASSELRHSFGCGGRGRNDLTTVPAGVGPPACAVNGPSCMALVCACPGRKASRRTADESVFMREGLFPSTVARRYPHGYAVVDVETSGLRPSSDRVLQVAVAQMAPDGQLETTWSTLLDPGCHPGRTDIHGLTRQKLAGSPQYPYVAARVAALVGQRVLVAHNAQFDWGFLSAEADRAHAPLQVDQRLCTLALTRRLDLPLPNMKLSSVADYWGVRQLHAHDAADDVRVLVEVLRHSLVAADRIGLHLPLAPCRRETAAHSFPTQAPRPPCPWKYPGRWTPGAPLSQGMKVVFTGRGRTPRETLTHRATSAGLDVMNSASSRTSVLVCDEHGCDSRKLESARHHGVPIVTEAHFLTLLTSVTPGTAKSAPARPSTPTAQPRESVERPVTRPRGPLTGRRVLILGGPHDVAAAVRERVAGAGGQAATNLTATVGDIVALDDAQTDPRWERVIASGLRMLDSETLTVLPTPVQIPNAAAEGHPDRTATLAATEPQPEPPAGVADPLVLSRGSVIDLPYAAEWSLSLRWPDLGPGGVDVDVVAFFTDIDEEVAEDADFLFFNAPTHPSGAANLTLDVPGEVLVNVRPDQLPDHTARVLIAAAVVDGVTFGDVGPIELVLRDQDGTTAARATLDAATAEQTLMLATLYRRGGAWRFRAIGQGYEFGLAGLAVRHGLDIEES